MGLHFQEHLLLFFEGPKNPKARYMILRRLLPSQLLLEKGRLEALSNFLGLPKYESGCL